MHFMTKLFIFDSDLYMPKLHETNSIQSCLSILSPDSTLFKIITRAEKNEVNQLILILFRLILFQGCKDFIFGGSFES